MKKGNTLKVGIHLLIIVFWAIMMFLLIKRENIFRREGVEANFRELIPRDIEVDDWKGVYISGKWAGYVHTTMGPYRESNMKGYITHTHSYLRFKMFEQLRNIELNSVQFLDEGFRLMRFEVRISGMTGIAVAGKRLGDHVMVEIVYNNLKYKKVFEAEDDFFLENSILSIYRGKGLRVGDSYTLNIFNPLVMALEPTTVEVVGKEGDLLILETKFGGLASKAWVDTEGHVVREEMANGWMMRLETMEEIKRYVAEYGNEGVDILTESAVMTKEHIDAPRKAGFMKIKVSGIDLADFAINDGKRQILIDKNRAIVEIRAVFPDEGAALKLPYAGGDEFKKYLKPSIWIQSQDPKIKLEASKIIGKETNSWLASKRIGKWVNENVDKSFSVGVPIATSVLVNREGDCNEHTVLFVALARAAGIPAEMCAGLVYMEDGFYYHAWPKVYVGEWVHLDPTFGQTVADATHFELVSGDFAAQSKLALTMGRINIEILESEVWRDAFDRD